MQKLSTKLEGPLLLRPVVYGDERGFLLESYWQSVLEHPGIDREFVQDTIRIQVGDDDPFAVRGGSRRCLGIDLNPDD